MQWAPVTPSQLPQAMASRARNSAGLHQAHRPAPPGRPHPDVKHCFSRDRFTRDRIRGRIGTVPCPDYTMEKSMTRILTLLLLWPCPPAPTPLALPRACRRAHRARRAAAAHAAAPATPHAAPATAAPAATKSDEDKLVFAVWPAPQPQRRRFRFNEHEKQLVLAGLANGLRDAKACASGDATAQDPDAADGSAPARFMAKTKAAGKAYRDKLAVRQEYTNHPPAASS